MPPRLAFGISVACGLLAWSVVSYLYLWPRLRALPRQAALRPLLVLHGFRFIGLSFLVTGVVGPELPATFAHDAAVGDLGAAVLAWIALALLPTRLGLAAAWLFNIWGLCDLFNAFFQAGRSGLAAGQLGATFYIPTVIVPLLLITHGLMVRILLKKT